MNLTSKYNIGDKVWTIQSSVKAEHIKCPTCEGIGKINFNNVWFDCPNEKCGKSWQRNAMVGYHIIYLPKMWRVCDCQLTIGLIRIEIWANQKNEYMCAETGIGSGTIHHEGKLFHTIEEAQAECDRLNEEGDVK